MVKQEILIHACCAPCAGYVLEKMSIDFIPVLYYCNPNIYPEQEYCRRRDELKKFAGTQKIEFIEEDYQPASWSEFIKGFEEEPERGLRCNRCFYFRLEKTADFACRNNLKLFTTTLTISPHKNSKNILEIGNNISLEKQILFLSEDFKKRDGFRKTMAIANKENFYRQNYCGCSFSRTRIIN